MKVGKDKTRGLALCNVIDRESGWFVLIEIWREVIDHPDPFHIGQKTDPIWAGVIFFNIVLER